MQRFISNQHEILVFTSPLPPDAIVERLQQHVVPPIWSPADIFQETALFRGYVDNRHFTLVENDTLGRRSSGDIIDGEVIPLPVGSQVTITIRPNLAGFVLLGVFFLILGAGFLFLLYYIIVGVLSVTCLIPLAIIVGTHIIVSRALNDGPSLPYINIEAHFRHIFQASTPAQRLPKR